MSYRLIDCLLAGTRWNKFHLDCLLAGMRWNKFHLVPTSKQSTNLYDIYPMLCVQS